MATPGTEQLRFITKVALMYHEEGLNQPQICAQLGIPQARVSRLLKQAVELGIVRTTVVPPAELHVDWERELVRAFGIQDVVIADAVDGHGHAVLGAAAATYLESTLYGNERLGISSWSASLLATAEAMRPRPHRVATEVVQLLGGVGNPLAQVSATRLTARFAELTGGEPRFLAAPGVVGSAAARDALLADPYVHQVVEAWQGLTTALVGIGALEPSPLLAESGNSISDGDQAELRSLGGVGDVCLHYFDAAGDPVRSSLDERVLGIPATLLRNVPRRIGVAGGMRKLEAIRAALRGGWINILITDSQVAAALISEFKERN